MDAACRRGERCLYFAFEESQNQILRNMRSIGLDLERWVDRGLLRFHNTRPTLYGLEMHLVSIHKAIDAFKPVVVVLDPLSNLVSTANPAEVKSMLARLIDYLKMNEITAFCTDLTTSGAGLERTEVGISSLMDTWLLLQTLEGNGERNRGLYILKSRGMEHSNQIREYLLTGDGIQLRDVYVGAAGVLTGSARTAQEARDRAESLEHLQEIERKRREIARKKALLEAQIAALHAEYEADRYDLEAAIARDKQRDEDVTEASLVMATKRRADAGRQRPEKTGRGGGK